MTLLVSSGSEWWTLQLERRGATSEYTITGATTVAGTASVIEVQPGRYSVLLADGTSITAQVTRTAQGVEVSAGSSRYQLSLADARDAAKPQSNARQNGPSEIRSQMPGKIIKILVEAGAEIQTGDALLVIEAMKMQNEMKASRDGRVSRVAAVEGTTVNANELLMVIE